MASVPIGGTWQIANLIFQASMAQGRAIFEMGALKARTLAGARIKIDGDTMRPKILRYLSTPFVEPTKGDWQASPRQSSVLLSVRQAQNPQTP